MSKNKSFYITTTIPYVNADPHIGFALELVQADALARYQRLMGREVFFSTGTDEYGQKIWEASLKAGKDAQDYVDHYAGEYVGLKEQLNLSYDNFIRTTSKENILAAQEFWRLCEQSGDIYKKLYKGLYCIGCEKFLTEKDLVEGECPLHPNKKPEIVEEENYFFKLTKYKEPLLKYFSNPESVLPEWRRKEAVDFVEGAMEDFSISRSKERNAWGIPIPGDDTQLMYVWFGAFVNYLSTLGWPSDKSLLDKFWTNGETVQVAGKDMVKFQSVMWQGMLLSAKLPTTDRILYHGFVTGEGGIRMSKSLGNVIHPKDIVQEYSADALRYFLLREISVFDDSPFTLERFKEAYNANLANGLGNLVSRILKLAETHLPKPISVPEQSIPDEFKDYMNKFEIGKAIDFVWKRIGDLDRRVQETEPFKLVKTKPEEAKKIIEELTVGLYTVARMLHPFLPEANIKIKDLIKANKSPKTPLFPRKD